MKKKKINLLSSINLLFLILAVSSCQKLVEVPEGRLTPSNFYQTPGQVESALTGSMSKLTGTWFGYNAYPQHFPDGQLDGASLAFGSTYANEFWVSHFQAISNINPILKAINDGALSKFSVAQVADLKGQARFLRAYNYFQLVRMYGKIPFIDENTPDVISTPLSPASRLDIAAIYDKIEADLLFAATNMADYDPSTPAKPNKWVAKGLLAKVYLTRATAPLNQVANFAKARDMADDVIVNGPYKLVTRISDVFSSANQNNIEMMFQYQSSPDYPAVPAVNNAPDEWGGWGDGMVKALWAQAYPEQPRKHIYLSTDWPVDIWDIGGAWVNYSSSNLGVPYNGKRIWPSVDLEAQRNDSHSGVMTPILRFADVLLIYAEAANMAGTGPTALAVSRLNMVINRANTPSPITIPGRPAGIPGLATPGTEALATTSMTQAQFDKKVLDERDYELCFELDRYFDVLRKKILKEVNLPDNANDFDANDYLFPIPPFDAGHIGNNPGY